MRPPPGLTVNLDNLCTGFVSFVSRLNRKIRVPKLLVTTRVFCLLKTASKCTQTSFCRQKMIFFSWEGPPHRTSSTPTAPHPLLNAFLCATVFDTTTRKTHVRLRHY